MDTDLDTLLIDLYVLVDDGVVPPEQPRPGRPKRLSDAELVCLAVAQVLLGARSEHHWLRLRYARLGHLFPYLPKQSGHHNRLKAAAPLICKTMLYLARGPTSCGWSTACRCRAGRPDGRYGAPELAGWANYGYCARTRATTGD